MTPPPSTVAPPLPRSLHNYHRKEKGDWKEAAAVMACDATLKMEKL